MGGGPVKRSVRLPEPESLVNYRTADPETRWQAMCDDGLNFGPTTYSEIKVTLLRGQRCLCAYCEMELAKGTDAERNSGKPETSTS